MFDWVPVVFLTFKILVFVACMFFAIKWHYDQGKKKGVPARTLLITTAKLVSAFILAVLIVVLLTLTFARQMGMDLML